MDPNFWHERWEANQIGFHQSRPHPMLLTHFDALSLAQVECVFVPLCGKTLDIGWLLAQGCRVAGAELSELAIEQLFAALGVEPTVTVSGKMKHYGTPDIDIFVGDIFDLTREMLGPVDAIFDRAALVALPEPMRVRYGRHLIDITARAPQLLVTFEYDQNRADGPPFSVPAAEISQHYQDHYEIAALARHPLAGGIKGVRPATENAWLLKPISRR